MCSSLGKNNKYRLDHVFLLTKSIHGNVGEPQSAGSEPRFDRLQELLEHREALLQCLELREGVQARGADAGRGAPYDMVVVGKNWKHMLASIVVLWLKSIHLAAKI